MNKDIPAIVLRDKIFGMFLGVGIGDQLGLSVEGWSRERIVAERGGRITEYVDGKGTSDDYQLTQAVAEALIRDPLNMDAQVLTHIDAYNQSTKGWGGTTRESVKNLINGNHWAHSGISGQWKGKGNGVAMKIAPLAVLLSPDKIIIDGVLRFVGQLAMMTHPTEMGVCSAFAQVFACHVCLLDDPGTFDVERFIRCVIKASNAGKLFSAANLLTPEVEDLSFRFELLYDHKEYTLEKIIADFGGGSCYCYNSLPFSYIFFCRNPQSIDALYDVVSAGGDADTNGSIVGALLGALHGPSIFPQHLKDGLVNYDQVMDVANRFCDKFC